MPELPDRPDDRPAPAPPPRTLRRSRSQRIVAGVCGGLAEYLGVDVALIRIVFVVLALAGGGGIVMYAVGWILIPEEPEGASSAAPGSGTAPPVTGLDSAKLILGGLLIAIGSILLVNMLVPGFGKYFWPLVLIAIGFAIIVQASRKST